MEQPYSPSFIHPATMSLLVSFDLFVYSSFLATTSFFLVTSFLAAA
jgi:hypothetical protein